MATTYVKLATEGTAMQLANTSYGMPSAARQIDIAPRVWYVRGDVSPFIHLSKAGFFRQRVVGDPKFQQFEQPEHAVTVKCTETVGATETTLTLDSSSPLKLDDRIMPLDGSGQIGRITTVTSSTAVTVKWYTANGTATATITTISINTYFLNLGNTSKEGSTLPQILQPQVAARTNYTETFRYPFGGTRHRLAAKTFIGRGIEQMATQEWIKCKRDIEHKLYWGVPTEQTITSTVYRTTGGLWYWITQQSGYSNDYTSATFSIHTLIDDMIQQFEYGSDTKIMIANLYLLGILAKMKDAKLQMRPSDSVYGLKVNVIEAEFGRLMVVPSLALTQPNSYGAGTMRGMGFILDPDLIDYVVFDQDMHIEMDKQAPDYDGTINEYKGDVGIAVNVSQAHGVIYGINAVDYAP